jgi:hypothetical protein
MLKESLIIEEMGQDKYKNFKEFKKFVNGTKAGIALTLNYEEDEIIYVKEEINKVFDIININTIKNIKYITDDFNLFIKKKAILELINNNVAEVDVL